MWLLLACVTEPASEACAACAGECLEETIPATGATHVDGDVAYADYPPTSGNHNPCWAEWGVHTDVVAPENWVHNLEHGGVVFVYAPTLEAADLTSLTTYVTSLPQGRAILTPASDPMDALVAAVSWEHRIELGCYDAEALDTFFWANVGHAPEDTTADPGTCAMEDTGGAGDTGDTAGR